jgi:hypothetical protein
VEWTAEDLRAALVDARFGTENAPATATALAGTYTLTFADGRFDLVLDGPVAQCAGTYTTSGNHASVASERGRCPETKLFDATFSVTDGELHLDDFYGIAQVEDLLATRPLEKIDERQAVTDATAIACHLTHTG